MVDVSVILLIILMASTLSKPNAGADVVEIAEVDIAGAGATADESVATGILEKVGAGRDGSEDMGMLERWVQVL